MSGRKPPSKGRSTVTALLNVLHSFRYYAPLVAVVALLWWHRFTFTTWFLKQFVTAAYGFAVSPVTEQQNQDINFWGAQIFGSVVVIMATWIVLTSSGWKAWILANVFESPIQKAVFKHFCMQALEDAVFLFTMRQVVVLTSWVVVPPAVQTDASSFAGGGAWLRYFVDARLATLLYIVTSLCWFGASVNLFTLPIDPMGRAVVSAALRGAVYLGVAVVRVYPLLNGRGVGLLEFALVLVTRYPLLAMALGWAAVAPAEWAGRQLRSRAGVTFYSIAGINAVNVASMLWSSAAGRHIAELMLDAEGTAAAAAGVAGTAAAAVAANATAASVLADVGGGGAAAPALLGLALSVPVELLFRALLLMLCAAALSMYVHALYLLYYSSPLLRCEFDWPRVTRVEFLEGGQVVDKVWALYSRHLEASVTASMASLKGSLSSTLASVLGSGRSAALQRGVSTDSAPGSGVGAGGAVPVELPPEGVAGSLQRGDSTASEAGAGTSTPATGAAAAPVGPNSGGGGGEDTGDRLLSLLMDVLDVAMSLHALAEGERFAIRFAASVRARNTTGRPMLLQACAIDVLAAPAPSAEGGLVMAAQGAGGSAVPYLQELQHLGQSAADAVPVVPPTLPVLTLHLDPVDVPAAGQADEGDGGNEHDGAGAGGDGAEGGEGGYYTCTVQVSVVAYLHVDNIVTLLQALPSWWSSGGSGAARAGRQGGFAALNGRRAPSQASLLGLSTLFATLYMRSPLSPSFVFSVPLLTWLRGQWRGIGLLDPSRYSQHLDISAALQNRAKLSALAENLSAKRASGTAGEVRQLPAEMQTDVAKLLLILQRINARGNVAAAAAASGLAAALSGEGGDAGGGRGQGHPAAFAGHALAASRGSRSSDGATPSGGSTRAPTAVTLASQGAVLPSVAHQRPPSASPSARALAAGGSQRSPRGRGLFSVLLSTTRNALRPFVPGWAGGSGEAGGRGALARDAASRSLRNRPFAAQTPDTTAAVVRAVLRTELPDLLRALYLIISLRRQLARLGLPLRAISSLLVEAGHALLHLFYDTVFVGFAGGRDPLHLLLLSGGALGLQALLQSIGESPGTSPPPAGAPLADAAASSGRGQAGSAAREPTLLPHAGLVAASAAIASSGERGEGELHRVSARLAAGVAGSPSPSAPADSPLSASGSQGARLYPAATTRESSAWAASGVGGATGAWLTGPASAVRAPSQGALGFADVLPPSQSPTFGAARGRSQHLPDKAPAEEVEVEEEEDGPAAEGAWGVARAPDHLHATQHEGWAAGAAGAPRSRGRARIPSDG